MEKEKKPINKKHLVITICVTLACLTIGGVGGYFLGGLFFPKEQAIDYSKMRDVDFEDDQVALMKRYNATKVDNYVDKFAPHELANISINKIKEHDYFVSKTIGKVDALGVEQTVHATSIKNKEEYFLENISASSMLQTGYRFYQKNDQITTYKGDKVETTKAVWDETPVSELSTVEHEEKWGKQLSRPFIYIISSKTAFDTSTAEKTSDGYRVRLDLSPKYSVLRYVRQMVSISPVKDPIFHSIQLNLLLDKDLNLLSTEINESYSVVMVVTAESVAHINETYIYDVDTSIPSLNLDLEY